MTIPAQRSAIDTGLRHVRCLEILEIDSWRVKLYGMTLEPRPPAESLLERARALVAHVLPSPAMTADRDGVAFATVHEGEHGDYLLVDWWHGQDLLKHHLFGAPKGEKLRYGWPQNVSCCVWEMAVLWFERNAWYRHVLDGGRQDLEGYLAERLEGTV